MEIVQAATLAGGGGGGGPAPFLLKTYDMVDDSTTDDIVSWSPNHKSFIVWNPPEFARLLLPTYFKHNNFSSFIRQLNTYGFRKIDPERWEFGNEDFMKDQKHLLKNIYRRKPIHSHSNPQGTLDTERAAFEEEIDKLSREKTALEDNLVRVKQQQSTGKLQFEDLTQRVRVMEQRQENLMSFMEKSIQSPFFVERLAEKLEFMDVSAYNKKRRLPEVDDFQAVEENMLVDDRNSSKPEAVNIFNQDFCNKLRLELSPCISDINLLSHSTQSSNEEGDSPQKKICEEWTKESPKPCGTLCAPPETLGPSDTGTSFNLMTDSPLPLKSDCLQVLSQCLAPMDEGDGLISCQLNLSLASSQFSAIKSHCSNKMLEATQEVDKGLDTNSEVHFSEAGPPIPPRNSNSSNDDSTLSSLHNNDKQEPATGPVRVNDVFWEQFLTERPGYNEELSTGSRANAYKDQEHNKLGLGMSGNRNSAEHLTL